MPGQIDQEDLIGVLEEGCDAGEFEVAGLATVDEYYG
jgi:hypothetical protein